MTLSLYTLVDLANDLEGLLGVSMNLVSNHPSIEGGLWTSTEPPSSVADRRASVSRNRGRGLPSQGRRWFFGQFVSLALFARAWPLFAADHVVL